MDDVLGGERVLEYGVTQKAVLGPTLFSLILEMSL